MALQTLKGRSEAYEAAAAKKVSLTLHGTNIFIYIGVVSRVNLVGIYIQYSIHGVSGFAHSFVCEKGLVTFLAT